MRKKPLISFCIPTYNRGNKVFDLVSNILRFQGDEIEVLVLDNLSTDNTGVLLDSISDSRFVYLRNDINIGGIKNPHKALTLANGEFCFLCLDKDFIHYEHIKELIVRLKSNDNVVFGYCTLNSKSYDVDILFEKGFASIYNMVYLSAHPTGMFYKTNIYKNLPILNHIFGTAQTFGFNSELINAEMSLYGKSLIIKLPIFYTETAEECGDVPSFTYLKESEVFFFPLNRYYEFLKYCRSLFNLDISDDQKYIVLKKIFVSRLFSATFGFRDALGNKNICNHYHISTREIGSFELIKLALNFSKGFIKIDLPVSYVRKLFICVYGNLKILYAMLKTNLIRNTN